MYTKLILTSMLLSSAVSPLFAQSKQDLAERALDLDRSEDIYIVGEILSSSGMMSGVEEVNRACLAAEMALLAPPALNRRNLDVFEYVRDPAVTMCIEVYCAQQAPSEPSWKATYEQQCNES